MENSGECIYAAFFSRPRCVREKLGVNNKK